MKGIKKTIAMILAVCSFLTATACGKKNDDKTIYVAGYESGIGTVWLEDLATLWNESNDSEYTIEVVPVRISAANLKNELSSGYTTYSLYFAGEVDYLSSIYNGDLEDLSDVLEMKVDGTDRKIIDKIGLREGYYDEVWKPIASINGEGMYMLPFCDNFGGMIFDYDTFVEKGILAFADESVKSTVESQGIQCSVKNGKLVVDGYTGDNIFFNYSVGDYILTCGKDGVYGTYDDGQPQTEAEWVKMLDNIESKNMKPFMWGGYVTSYADMVLESVFAYYGGMSQFNSYYDFNGTVKINGEDVAITPDNGYRVYEMDAMRKSLEFMNTYLNNPKYYHDATTDNTVSHIDAQGKFILGFSDTTNPSGAMLIDGNWWENEARKSFNLQTVINADRGYGQRDYRYMLIPKIDGAYGLDGNGSGSIMSVLNSGAMFVPKVGESEEEQQKLAQIKDFIGFILKDENLVKFTKQTGIVNAYSYNLSSEDFASLTPFSRNVYSMIKDTENIEFARGMLKFASQPIRFATNGFSMIQKLYCYGGANYAASITALRQSGATIDGVMADTKKYYKHIGNENGYTSYTWEGLLEQARKQGFYKN